VNYVTARVCQGVECSSPQEVTSENSDDISVSNSNHASERDQSFANYAVKYMGAVEPVRIWHDATQIPVILSTNFDGGGFNFHVCQFEKLCDAEAFREHFKISGEKSLWGEDSVGGIHYLQPVCTSSPSNAFQRHFFPVLGWSLVSIPLIAVWFFLYFLFFGFSYKGSTTSLGNAFATPVVVPWMASAHIIEMLNARGWHVPDGLEVVSIPLTWGFIIHCTVRLVRVLRG
jgi:hypothetical protein